MNTLPIRNKDMPLPLVGYRVRVFDSWFSRTLELKPGWYKEGVVIRHDPTWPGILGNQKFLYRCDRCVCNGNPVNRDSWTIGHEFEFYTRSLSRYVYLLDPRGAYLFVPPPFTGQQLRLL